MVYRSVIDVHLICERDGQVLLAEGSGTGYADGQLNVPGGKLEDGETVVDAAIREAHEELGIEVEARKVRFVTVVHHRNPEGEARVGFFFATDTWDGDPVNAEPDKCAGLCWVDPLDPPDNTIDYSVTGLAQLRHGAPFALEGWPSR